MSIKRPVERGGWRAPPQGSTARKKMPNIAFLQPRLRKYPYRVYRKGHWVPSERGLMAAYKRASQQHNMPVRRLALVKLNRIRKDKGKPPVG